MHIIGYNVLAQAYLLPERYLGIPPEYLEAEARQSRLIQHIQNMDADLICLQEVEPALFEKLQAALPAFQGLYAPKLGRPDGLATFYKPSLTLTHQQVLHFENADPGYDHIAQVLGFKGSPSCSTPWTRFQRAPESSVETSDHLPLHADLLWS